MPKKKSTEQAHPAFTPTELAHLDALITHLQEEGVKPGDKVPLFTPVAAVYAGAVLSTAAVLCLKVDTDQDKIQQIKDIAGTLETHTTLENLLELRRRAVTASSATTKSFR